ncbi:serine threonine- kinase [Lecanosticta acicola]|uniref:Serine threonine- kinase n=1 Tax=Lecanosticta acicola TaxID=111012 RepID=A0AAI8YYF7_9PEZI|nr:serine threonine- kinase [Lecanosticta acicola]
MLTDAAEAPSTKAITKQDVSLFEVFAADSGAFRRTIFTYVDFDHRAWAGEALGIRKYNLADQDIRLNIRQIPDDDVFPKLVAVEDATLLSQHADAPELFLKRPQIHCLLEEFGGSIVPQMLLEEVHIMEFLARHPHPNIVPYHGCVVRRGYITGIALTRYQKILDHRFHTDTSGLDLNRFEQKLRDAISHIHALGLAHNDLNPTNIALDSNDDPIVIDWGSCKDFGELLLSAGTPGWIEDDFDVSKKEHDLFAIGKIMAWMREEQAKLTGGIEMARDRRY